MLTLRQVDNVVQTNLFIIKDWEHKREEQGTTILYSVWSNAIFPKLYLGVFRVWEWIDGSGRCGWQPLPEASSEQEKLRRFFHVEMVIPILVDANNTIIDPSRVQVDAGKAEKPVVENTRIPTGRYDNLCILWVNRPYIPNQTKEEFLYEHASELDKKTFDRILKDAHKRKVIDKINGRYKPKTVS